jgi:hypothetical protein
LLVRVALVVRDRQSFVFLLNLARRKAWDGWQQVATESFDEEIGSRQGYESKESYMKGIESVKNNASKAKIVGMTK